MMPRHILIPLDRDSHAERTLAYAVPLATALHAATTLLHVVEPTSFQSWDEPLPLTSAAVPLLPSPEADPETQRFMTDKLQCVRNAGLRCDAVVILGAPFQIIINMAQARGIDLIIMGSHGRTGLAHLVLGSVAERVVRLAPCPVLVVR